jgi:ribosome biogenesis GTPase
MPDDARKKRGKTGGKTRVDFRRNRQKPGRQKDWTGQMNRNAEATEDTAQNESVVAKGALSRKRTVKDEDDTALAANLLTGRVMALRGLVAEVHDGETLWACTVRRILRTRLIEDRHPVTVGDRVRFAPGNDAARDGVIMAVEPRRGVLQRKVDKRIHTIVANVDQAIIVSSAMEPHCKPHLIDRYIVAAHSGGIEPIVCMNKIELDEDDYAREVLELYAGLGYRTIASSARTGIGIEELRALLATKCSVIAGQSGVGKSSLLNALDPTLNLRTGQVSVETFKGKHITTTAVLIPLAVGGFMVDTPGIRSLDLAVVPVGEIEMHFRDIAPFVPNCHFPDCFHTHETKCAVKQAVEEGKIDPDRYDSYCRMIEERLGGGDRG